MSSKIIFIYDGECPFCNHFAQLLELKSKLPDLEVKDARQCPPEIPKGYDMDISGAILIQDGEVFNGAIAINRICAQIQDPSNGLLKTIRIVFTSKQRSNFLFPFLIIARRIALIFKGVPTKLIE